MERNMTLLIDPETRDLVFDEDGIMSTIYDDETSSQSVRLTLQVYRDELPFDTTHGVLYDRILGRHPHELQNDEIAEIIRAGVFQESNVAQIDNLTAKVGEKRRLDISVSGRLTSGAPFNVEVVTG